MLIRLSDSARLFHADCRDAIKSLPDNSIDSVVTDPPYGLQFMGAEWDKLWRDRTEIDKAWRDAHEGTLAARARKLPDYSTMSKGADMQANHLEWAKEVFRVLKPGGFIAAFSASRTYHRMACAIEDAGFEIRDSLMWVYAVGFPKSRSLRDIGRPELGTALKPAHEPIVLARKPLSEGTVAANVLRWGTGALNIDGCRVPGEPTGIRNNNVSLGSASGGIYGSAGGFVSEGHAAGRWPANVVHDGSDEVVGAFPDSKGQQGDLNATGRNRPTKTCFGDMAAPLPHPARNDSGSAARFFFSTAESDTQWLARNLPRNHASNAENCFSLSSELAVSVLRNAADLSTLELVPKNTASPAPSMNVTPSELRRISDHLITMIQSIERRCSPESLPEKRSLSDNLVCIAATREQIDTITITISPSKSNGSVEPVTFNITLPNSDRGAKDCAPSLARFHYSAKASKADRNGSKHPTVKPIALMEWLATLITPPGGTILDPFAGSGTTGAAAVRGGFHCILVEREDEYVADIKRRLGVVDEHPWVRVLAWNAAVARWRAAA